MRTLVVHTGGIGDFLLACPAIAQLEGPVELLGRVERLAPAVEAGIAAAAHDLDAVDFHTLFASPNDRARGFLEGFDRAVVWMRDPDGTLERGLRACGVARVEVYPGLPDADWTGHAAEYYAGCLGVTADPGFRLGIAPSAAAHDVVIHPGSGSVEKNWPLERFRTLAGALVRDGRRVEWCLGPAELERMPEASALEPRLEAGSLVDVARALANARLYIGNDSGITHLAALVGCPTVALFGPTDPRVWAPRGEHIRILQDPGWPEVVRVMAACVNLLG